jgi:hypothetical protein
MGLSSVGSPTSEDFEIARRVRAEVDRWTYKPGWLFRVEVPASDIVVIHVDIDLEGPNGRQVVYHNAHAIVMSFMPKGGVADFFIRDSLHRLINGIERDYAELWLVQTPLLAEVQS